jgi:ABC-type nitrate/sulfonate/bicarbonate transport system permease component
MPAATAAATPVAREAAGPASARRRLVPGPRVVLPLVSLAVFLSVWELVGRMTDPLLFAPPSRVVGAIGELIASGQLISATLTTLSTLAAGYGLAIVVGVLLGVVMGRTVLGELISPYFYAIFATPRVVVIPVVIVWFGVGYSGRLFLVFLWSMIAIAASTADGVRNARPDLVEVARSYGASRSQLARHVLLPGAVPFVLSGLRVGAERAVVGVIIAEMFLQLTGIGGLIRESATQFHTADTLAGVITIAAIGTILITLVDIVESRFSRWRSPSSSS